MLRLSILNKSLLRAVRLSQGLSRSCSDSNYKKSGEQKTDLETKVGRTETAEKNIDEDLFELPPEPDNCCMSGCANCVWIQYAKDLTDLYEDSGGTAKKIILEKIKDPTMQVFIKMELSSLLKK